MKSVYVKEYANQIKTLSNQYNQRSEYFIDNYERIVRKIAQNNTVQQTVCSNFDNSELNYIITDIIKHTDVLGVSVYGRDYAFFSDKVIGSAPEFEFIKKSYLTETNFNSDLYWIIRTPESYKGYYNRAAYKSCNQGLYTCIYKIKDESGSIAGYILLDINIKKIFDVYCVDNVFDRDMEIYLKDNKDNILGYMHNKNIPVEVLKSKVKENDTIVMGKQIYIGYTLSESDNSLILSVKMTYIYMKLHIILFCMIVIALIFYICGAYAIKLFTGRLIQSVKDLDDKINKYTL